MVKKALALKQHFPNLLKLNRKMDVVNSIKDALSSTFNTTAEFIPQLIGAIIIFLIGWIVAKILRTVINKLLKTVKFDDLADNIGINGMLAKGGLKRKASGMLATLVYWIVMFVTWGLVFNSLGLEVVSNLLSDVVQYIPNVIVACILLVVGTYLAQFVSGLVSASLKASNFSNEELVTKVAYGGVMFFTVVMALNQLGIGQGILDKVVSIVLGGLGLGLAIAFGLGGKEWAAGMIKKISD